MYIYVASTNYQLLNRFRLHFAGYRYISIPSIMITLVCVASYSYTGISGIVPLTWLKLFTTGLFLFFINYSKRKEFFYYYNLGISKRNLFISAVLFDLLLYTIAITTTIHFSSALPVIND